MQAFLTGVQCAACKWVMMPPPAHPFPFHALTCANKECVEYGKYYRAPSFVLEEIR